jgi:serine/threonine-protein kinase
MAEVYRAIMIGAEGFEKVVAIKKVLPHLTDNPDLIKMFIDEAMVVSRLNHPNIVQVYDFEKFGDQYLLVMEYVHGRPLSKVLARCQLRHENLPVNLAIHVTAETAAALGFAHGKTDDRGALLGIVHRDISPQNIMISVDGLVKVTDFGIAKRADRRFKTRAGHIKGKLGYLSPEQVWGKPLDRRSDIFSLGVVAHQMIAGYGLFRRESEAGMIEAIQQWRGLGETDLPEGTPGQVRNILTRLLQPDRDNRYRDARELLSNLKGAMRDMAIEGGTAELGSMMFRLFGEELTSPATAHTDRRPLEEMVSSDVDRFESLLGEETRIVVPGSVPGRSAKVATEAIRARTRPWWRRGAIWLVLSLVMVLGAALLAITGRQDPDSSGAEPVAEIAQAEDGASSGEHPDGGEEEDRRHAADEGDAGGSRSATSPGARDDVKPRARTRLGTLFLNSYPWAFVEIDGKRLKGTTPIMGLRLGAGRHSIRLSNPLVKRSTTIQVRILPGKATRRAVRF